MRPPIGTLPKEEFVVFLFSLVDKAVNFVWLTRSILTSVVLFLTSQTGGHITVRQKGLQWGHGEESLKLQSKGTDRLYHYINVPSAKDSCFLYSVSPISE